MSTKTLAAIILITLGALVIAYKGVIYTTREKVVDVGNMEITADRTRTFIPPPWAGGVMIGGGIVLLLLRPKVI